MDKVRNMQFKLYKLGYLLSTQIDNLYGPITTAAVKKFQADNGLPPTGTADAKTLARLSEMAAKYNADFDDGDAPLAESEKEEGENAWVPEKPVIIKDNSPFFDIDTVFRKSNVPIRIEYGPNRTSKKTITNVFFRSLGQQLDGSGNPLYDTIEFIGRDIEEE